MPRNILVGLEKTFVAFDRYMLDLAIRFVSMPADEIDAAITGTLSELCFAFDVEFTALAQFGHEPGTLSFTHFHSTNRQCQSAAFKIDLSSREFFYPWIAKQLSEHVSIVARRLDDLPPEAAVDKHALMEEGTLSAVFVPITFGALGRAGLYVAARSREQHWTQSRIDWLGRVGRLFGNALTRKFSELALRSNESRARAMLESITDGILVVTAERAIEYANAATVRIFGYRQAELIGKDIQLLRAPPAGGVQRGCRRDGTIFDLNWSENKISFGGRQLTCVRVSENCAAHDLSGMLLNAQEEERARLARELHDDITQRLARLAIDVGRIRNSAPENSATQRLAGEVRDSLVQLSDDVHALSYDLHPSVLVDLGLVDALRAECSKLALQLSMPVHVKMRDLPDAVPRKVAIAFFRIAQEALRNAVRHGCPTQLDLSLRGEGGGLELAVHDNGIGFDPKRQRPRPSLGMASMRERARLLGGEVDIESEPSHGTTVIAWIPLREDSL